MLSATSEDASYYSEDASYTEYTYTQSYEYSTEQSSIGGAYKWKTLEHNGVLFPPEYEKHNIPVTYKGKNIILDKLAEEYATIYARYTETEYIKNRIFNKNFWKGWKKMLSEDTANIIKNLEDCDFSKIYDYLVDEKEKRKELAKEEKEKIKEEKDKIEEKYKVAYVDGEEQPVGNFRIEPPGLFIGRGCHPKMGSLKYRIYPEDITINIGKDAKAPDPLPGHQWKEVIHDRNSEWLASWKDTVTGKSKYVWLGAHSKFKAESDIKKFNLARSLKRNVGKIRQTISEELDHEEESVRQAATALSLIDDFALRIGNEKGEDAADTVGVTSLRVEHIIFLNNNKITLDFLSKDSIRYKNTHQVDPKVYKNLKEFTKGKDPKEQLFDKIDASFVNKYLQSFMRNLTAKVFRTYNASNLFQKELNKISKKMERGEMEESLDTDESVNTILELFNKANVKVALLCNHQKKVSKGFNKQIEKFNERVKKLKDKISKIRKEQAKRIRKGKKKSKRDIERIKKLKEQIKELNAKKKIKIELKDVSLETSKANYIDPRITAAFIKKHNLPVDKIYSTALQEKFQWAFEVDENWKF